MRLRRALVYLVVFLGALLAAYGASYGVRASNLVFLAGIALIGSFALVEWFSFRRLFAVPIAITVSGLFFFLAGYPTLSLPVCPPPPEAVACAGEGARDRTVVALGWFALGLILMLALGLRRRSAEPSDVGGR